MKKISILIIPISILMLSGCIDFDDSTGPVDNDDSIRGSDNIVAEVRPLDQFHSVNIATAGKVNLTTGAEQEVIVRVDDNLMEYIRTDVQNGRLTIHVQEGVRLSNMNLEVNITITDLKALTTSSAGSITGKSKFVEDEVNLSLSSAGNIELELEVNRLYSNLSSAGNLILKGVAKEHRATLSSAGKLHAFDLATETTIITVSSAGSAEISVSELLDATLSSIGSVYYKGNPTVFQTLSSLGRLIKVN